MPNMSGALHPTQHLPLSTSETGVSSSSKTDSSSPSTRTTGISNHQEVADSVPSGAFLAEVDEWLNQISKRMEELERRHRAHLSIEIKWTPELRAALGRRKLENEGSEKRDLDVTITKA